MGSFVTFLVHFSGWSSELNSFNCCMWIEILLKLVYHLEEVMVFILSLLIIHFLEDNDTFVNVLSINFLEAIFDFKVNFSKSDLAGLIVNSYVLSSIASLDVVKLYSAPSHNSEFLWVVILFYFFWKSWDYSDLCFEVSTELYLIMCPSLWKPFMWPKKDFSKRFVLPLSHIIWLFGYFS